MTKTTQYKNTPIGPIPTDWEVKKLREIGKFFKGKGVPKTEIIDSGYKCLTYGDLYSKYDFIIKDIKSFISDETAKISQKIEYGDICFAGSGETTKDIGKCAVFIDDDFGYAGGDIIVYRSKGNNPITLSYILNSEQIQNIKSRLGQGNSIVHIYSSQLENIHIPLPPLPEQQKIAEVLSTWDKAIQETDAIIKKLEARNKALANKLFEENNWQINKLSDLFERITDKNKEGNTTVTTISAKHGFIRQEDFFNKTVASKDLSNYYLINKGDFCYNKSYSKDYDWGVVKRLNDFEKAVVTTLYICFRFKDNSQNSDFWELYFENKILDKGLSKVAQEGGRAHGLLNVTSGDFFGIKVKVPSLEEQNAIAEILNTANQEVKQYQQKLEALKLQKKGLMQQLLTGKVRTV